MIPKIIHYCWFGRQPKPQKVLECIETWKKYCPGYEIKEWNEENFDYKALKYTREAYAINKFAFVSDVARLYALYNYGGIYFDTDILVLKGFDDLLNNKSFIGYEADSAIGTGVIGAEKGVKWLHDFYNLYISIPFITKFGNLDLLPNTLRIKKIPLFKQFGIDYNEQMVMQQLRIYPFEYFCAKDFKTGEKRPTKYTYCIHDYAGSWVQARHLTILMRLKFLATKLYLFCCTNK